MKTKIFTQNTWLIPFPFSKHAKKRTKDLILTIKKLDPDIITLQEVSKKSKIKHLMKKLPEYHFSFYSGKKYNSSGLLTLSKKKPLNTRFIKFKKVKIKSIAKIPKRGILITEFKDHFIYNIHLFAVINKEDVEKKLAVTKNEFELLKKYIEKDKICFVCGDFNLTKNQFDNINNDFFEYAENTGDTFSFFNQYVKKWWDKNVTANKKIDYILVKLPKGKKLAFTSRTIEKPILSDHYGILSEIDVK
jgi:exonuclease III